MARDFHDDTMNSLAMTGAQMGRSVSATVAKATLQFAQMLMMLNGTKGQPEGNMNLLYQVAETLRTNMVAQLMSPLAAFVIAEHKERGAKCDKECAAHLLRTLFEEMIPTILDNASSLEVAADAVVKARVAEEMMSDEDRLTDKEREEVVKNAMASLAALMASGGKPS